MNSFVVTSPEAETVTLTVVGDWSIRDGVPSVNEIARLLAPPSAVRRMTVEAAGLIQWDSALLSFLFAAAALCRERGLAAEFGALPTDVRSLLELATAAPRHTGPKAARRRPSFIARTGAVTAQQTRAVLRFVAFLGETVVAFGKLLSGRARYRSTDLALTIQECGAQALPIVSVISLLVGMIFAFVGAIQLKQFGAGIYDANLVAVAMAREMAAVMTGIVLTGRTGAAFAAQIGAMQANEEIDALSTLGISPVEFLVLPRMLALLVMTPLLCIYANIMGILGGFCVAINILDVTPVAYLLRTREAVSLGDFGIGLVKGAVFGGLVAITGCLCGIQSGRSASAVGAAATSAVVSGILAIIVADAIFAVLLNILGL